MSRLLFIGVVLISSACNSSRGPSIQLTVAPVAQASPDFCGKAAQGDTVTAGAFAKIRVTMRARGADGKTIDFCDSVFNVGGTPPFLRAPKVGGTQIDVFAEAYGAAEPSDPTTAGGLRRLASGSLIGLDPEAKSAGPLRLFPSEVFRCAGATLLQPRAFHSATRLPDGRVLFVGGLVASASEPNVVQFPTGGSSAAPGVPAIGGAEIYDPLTQTVIGVAETTPPTPRAFHHAALLPSAPDCPAGQVEVLLIGGLGPRDPTKPAGPILGLSHGGAGSRLVPFDGAAIGLPLATAALPDEALCLDAKTNVATRVSKPSGTMAAGFQGADASGDVAFAAGGADYDPNDVNNELARNVTESISLPSGSRVVGATSGPRVGCSATILDPSHALVWGGGLPTDPVGELVNLSSTSLASAPLSVASAITRFHTATLVGSAVLVTGGFEVTTGGVVNEPPLVNDSVRLISVSPSVATATSVNVALDGFVIDSACGDPNRYRPAGWESAVALSRDRALVTGGTPSTTMANNHCIDCPDQSKAQLLCVVGQAGVYDAATQHLARTTEPMQTPRLGHTSTVLTDGVVLVVGGIGNTDPQTPVFLGDIEVYNPTTKVAPFDMSKSADDLDDPILDDLKTLDLQRAPGTQAIVPGSTVPARDCGTL